MRFLTFLLSGGLTALLLVWTSPGESSDPMLALADMPREIARSCVNSQDGTPGGCDTRWLSRSPRGDLFLIAGSNCSSDTCRVWFVEKGREGSSTLLALQGRYQLLPGRHLYPSVQSRLDLSATQVSHSRFDWVGDRYVRSENHVLYRVEGVECGVEERCRELAQEALRAERVDRAVKIWQSVHGVSWI
jgi:hypothetical protein